MEKWWNVTFCWRLFHCQTVREGRECENDGKRDNNLHHTRFILHAQQGSFWSSSLQNLHKGNYFGWHPWLWALLVSAVKWIRFEKRRQSHSAGYFYSTKLSWINLSSCIIIFHLNSLNSFIRESVRIDFGIGRPEIPSCLSSLCLGWEIFTWYDKLSEFHGEQKNVFVIFVREDERDRDQEWNVIIENTQTWRRVFLLKNNPLAISVRKKKSQQRLNQSSSW